MRPDDDWRGWRSRQASTSPCSGTVAGKIAPTFFAHLIPWSDVEPRGIATAFGSIAGVLLGGGLATFGIIIQILMQKRNEKA